MDLSKLVSRKLLVALVSVGGLVLSRAFTEAAAVAVSYITMQGVVDRAAAKKAE